MNKAPKIQYSESETAAILGITVAALRSLVREYIVKDDTSEDAGIVATYRASDLVMLRVLTKMSRSAESAHA